MNPRAFDSYIRSLTAAALAVGIVATVIYESIQGSQVNAILTGWAGLVVGVYFGAHVAQNGAGAVKRATDDGKARASEPPA